MLRKSLFVVLAALALAVPAFAEEGAPAPAGKEPIRQEPTVRKEEPVVRKEEPVARKEQADPSVLKLRGLVVTLGREGIGLRAEDWSVRCRFGPRLALKLHASGVAVGDRLAVLCVGHERLELVRFEPLPKLEPRLVDIAGVVARILDGSIVVSSSASDRTLACAIPERLAEQAGRLQVGDRVKMLCATREEGAELLMVARLASEQRPPATEPSKPKPELPATPQTVVERSLAGVVAALGDGFVSVKGEASETLTCRVPERLAGVVAELSVGQKVRVGCRGLAGSKLELQAIERIG